MGGREGSSGAGGTSKLESVDEGGLDDYWAAAGAGFGRGPQPPEELVCPITNELMKDPVRAADGRLYEKEAIEVRKGVGEGWERELYMQRDVPRYKLFYVDAWRCACHSNRGVKGSC